jgi:hypothetical protein
MLRHESACTLNPNRRCNVCNMLVGTDRDLPGKQWDVALLVGMLPKAEDLFEFSPAGNEAGHGYFPPRASPIINECLPALREACNNCPACILAAIRQAKIPVPCATDFSFTDEMKAVWQIVNERAESIY